MPSRSEGQTPEPAPGVQPSGTAPPPGRALRALLVEDNRGDITLIQHALKDAAVKVDLHVEDDGVKALDFLRRTGRAAAGRLPDFILLDLKLPRKTGLEVLSEIKREPELRQIPVVILTSSNAVTDVKRAYELQAAAYFVKPVAGLEGVVGAIVGFMSSARLPDSPYPSQLSEALRVGRGAGVSSIAPPGAENLERWLRGQVLAAIVEGSYEAIISLTLDGTITTWNRAAEHLYGYTEQEALGQNIRLIVPEEGVSEAEEILAAVRRGEHVKDYDTVRISREGKKINVSKSASPIRDGRGNIVGVSIFGRDVTQRRQIEEKFQIAFESSPNAIVMVDARGEIILANAEMERLFGYTRAELIGQPFDRLVPDRFRGQHPGHRAGFMARPEARAMGAGRDLFGLRKDGSEFPVEIGLRPIDTPGGTVVLSAIVDITERKQAEERFRLAVESSPSAMVMVDESGAIVLVNAETERLFGYPRDELIGRSMEMLVPERLRAQHPYLRAQFLARPEARAMGAGRELHGLRKDGTEFPVEIGLNPIHTTSGTLVLSAIVDITERKLAEERFRLAVESSPSAMVMVDAAGTIVMVNAETERLFGYRRDELYGKPVEVIVPKRFRPQHPHLRAGFVAHPEARVMGAGRELHGLRKDGTEVPVEIGLTPIKTARGILVLSAIVDITERKRAGEVVAEQTRELARSNAELEQFAYVASHDLQEPLRTVASYTGLLARRYGEKLDDDARMYIQFARDGAIRMQSLIEGLLAYSRVSTRARELAPVDSGLALRQAVANLAARIEEAEAEVSSGGLPGIEADHNQLVELFQNLIGNAIKFRGDRPPRVEVAARRQGPDWVFSVADNGIGIEGEFFDRIFQVFQRLHGESEYPGTGIGLAICKRIVERMGGHIWVESTPGAGATFYFSVPADPAASVPRSRRPAGATEPEASA